MSKFTDHPISNSARIAVLEQELDTVRFLAAKAADDEHKAAAALRALDLQREIETLKSAA